MESINLSIMRLSVRLFLKNVSVIGTAWDFGISIVGWSKTAVSNLTKLDLEQVTKSKLWAGLDPLIICCKQVVTSLDRIHALTEYVVHT